MRSIFLINIFVVFSIFSSGICDDSLVPGGEEFFKRNEGRGAVSLKSYYEPNLCIRTVRFNDTVKLLRLLDCQMKFQDYPYEGEETFDISNEYLNSGDRIPFYKLRSKSYTIGDDGRKIPAWSRIMRNPDVHYYIFASLSGSKYGVDYDNFRFPQVDGDNVLVETKSPSGNSCLRAVDIRNGSLLNIAECNNKDPNQVWTTNFKEHDWKIYNSSYHGSLAPKNVARILQGSFILLNIEILYLYVRTKIF